MKRVFEKGLTGLLFSLAVFIGCDNLNGTGTVSGKTALKNAIDSANATKSGIATSVDGMDIDNTVYWVTTDQLTTFSTAITAAQAVYDSENTDETMADNAKTVLENAIAIFNSYKQAGTKTGGTTGSSYNVLIAGMSNGKACYWLDGAKTDLSNAAIALLLDMDISGTDVYIAGNDGSNPCYWKNGNKVTLSGAPGSWAEGIAVSGSDVYVVGSYTVGTKIQACYWKNGVKTDLTGNDGHARDVAVVCANVIIAGEYVNSDFIACYWRNGTKYDLPLPAGKFSSGATSIAAAGNNFYIGGFYWDSDAESGSGNYGMKTLCYWVNGTTRVDLPLPASTYSYERAIAVSKSRVYVGADYSTGGAGLSCYWTNGVKTDLVGGIAHTQINGMAAIDDDVHIVGVIDNGSGDGEAAYWINGTKTDFPVDGYGQLILLQKK